jgi:hypothetical protein
MFYKIDNIEKLCEILHLRFGTTGMTGKYRTELRTRRRRRGETLQELHLDIQRLASLSLKVREREPSTLDDAAKIAIRLESYQSYQQPENNNFKEHHRFKALQQENAELKSRMDQLELHVKQNESTSKNRPFEAP